MGAQTGDDLNRGLVVASHGRHCLLQLSNSQRLMAYPRGKKNLPVVGDWVRWLPSADACTVEAIEPRRSFFYRQDALRTKAFAANVDQVLLVLAAEPEFSEQQLARVLIAAESAGIRACIAVNKLDLASPHARARKRLQAYEAMGYPIWDVGLRTVTGQLSALSAEISGKVTLVIGASGVGKSSLINHWVPDAQAQTGEISKALQAGRHTTTTTTWYDVKQLEGQPVTGTALIDSPGFQEFGLQHIELSALAQWMPDLNTHLGSCRFHNCTHRSEPGCAIRDQVLEPASDQASISAQRYRIYLQLYDELEAVQKNRYG